MSFVSLWFLVPLTFASLFGILINAYILLVVLVSRQLTSVNNLLLFHLGTLNLCLGAMFLIFSAPGLVHNSWLSHGSLCYLHGSLFTILHPLILWTVCGLNADRYYAIAAPLHYGHLVNPRKVFLCLGIGWAISLVFTTFPFFHVAPFMFNRGLGACVPNFQSGRRTLWYSATYTAFTLLLPITLIICCNIKILMIARYHRHRIASAIYEVTLSAQVTITHQRNPFFVPTVTAPSSGGPKFRSRSPVSTVLQLLGSFVILYVPYYSIILWESCVTFLEPESKTYHHELLYELVLVLLTLSPTINGFLYGVKNKNLRKTFQNYWRKKLMKSEVNQEIQARTPSTCGSRRQSLTPLGFFTRPNITRRLSESLLDSHDVDSPHTKNQIKRIASELSWRPKSQTEILLGTEGTLQIPTPNSSECNLEQTEYLKSSHENCATAEANNLTNKCPQDVKNQLVLPLEENLNSSLNICNHETNEVEEFQRKRSFLYKLFGFDNTKAPKILITRALSEDDYSKNARELSKHSLSVSNSLSKWYHHSDYNLISDQTEGAPDVNTKLLPEHRDNDDELTLDHYDGPVCHRTNDADNKKRSFHFIRTDSDTWKNLSGRFMNLESCDALRTQSCDFKQIQSIQTDLPYSSFEAEENRQYSENVHRNAVFSLKTRELLDLEKCSIELSEQQHEVVL